jgi:transposase InsO family protein
MLAEYEPFDIKYRRGESNKVADALSRVYAWSECMPDVAFACSAMLDDGSDDVECPISTAMPPNPATYINIPTHKMLVAGQASDDFCIKQRVLQCKNKSDMRSDRGYIIRDGLVGMDRFGRFLPILPECFRDKFLQEVHSHPMSAHMGARRLASRAGQMFAIPHLRKYCREVCNGCNDCLRRKKPQPKVGQLASRPPTKAWELISMDFCGPYPESVHGYKYVLVIIDQFTKYVHLTPCKLANARSAYRALYEKIICNYGTPDKLLTDNGSHFRNKYLAAICAMFGIYQTFSSPYYPQGDGQVERFMRNMNDSLSSLTTDQHDTWCEYVSGVQSAYNSTPHAATFVAPYEMLYGFPPPPLVRLRHVTPVVPISKDAVDEAHLLRATLENVSKVVRNQIERSWMQRAIAYNKGRSKISIVVGERCLIRLNPAQLANQKSGKLRVRWSEPVLVTAVKASGKAFDVKTRDGRAFVVNATRMLPLPPSHWHAKRPTMNVTWDENTYIPTYPGVDFCVVAPYSGNNSADNIEGVNASTQTEVQWYPESSDLISDHNSHSGGNGGASSSESQDFSLLEFLRGLDRYDDDDSELSSLDASIITRPSLQPLRDVDLDRTVCDADEDTPLATDEAPSINSICGNMYQEAQGSVAESLEPPLTQIGLERIPVVSDVELSSNEPSRHLGQNLLPPSDGSIDSVQVSGSSGSLSIQTTRTSELSQRISLTSDHSAASSLTPVVEEQ